MSMQLSRKMKSVLDYGVFVMPALLLILITTEIPFIMNVIYAFAKWNGISRTVSFVGLKNFIELFTDDPGFWSAVWFTALFTIFHVVITNALALLLAIFLDQHLKTKNMLRAAFFIPNILSLVVVGFMWKFIFTMGFEAFFNSSGLGFLKWSWLGEPKLAFFSLLGVSIWQVLGFYMVIYIAGLQSVPPEIMEAAKIDGVGQFQNFYNITLPLLMPSLTVSIFLSMANSLKIFDLIFTLTNGGPGGSTISIAFDIYREAFINNRYGYATAKSVVFFLAVLIVTVMQVRFFKSKEVEY